MESRAPETHESELGKTLLALRDQIKEQDCTQTEEREAVQNSHHSFYPCRERPEAGEGAGSYRPGIPFFSGALCWGASCVPLCIFTSGSVPFSISVLPDPLILRFPLFRGSFTITNRCANKLPRWLIAAVIYSLKTPSRIHSLHQQLLLLSSSTEPPFLLAMQSPKVIHLLPSHIKGLYIGRCLMPGL